MLDFMLDVNNTKPVKPSWVVIIPLIQLPFTLVFTPVYGSERDCSPLGTMQHLLYAVSLTSVACRVQHLVVCIAVGTHQ
jgi:hypothetical protein